jgi:hypothetical protein
MHTLGTPSDMAQPTCHVPLTTVHIRQWLNAATYICQQIAPLHLGNHLGKTPDDCHDTSTLRK